MITKLHIKNIGIIDDLEIDFNKGLNVDEIATELSCSISEVQFIIDML